MSRSSLVWGPFSIVWGLALALVTWFLYKYKDRSESFLFLTGTFLGGAYEYLCSVFTEIFFGKVFWDYSKLPFNLGGRINLLYCFFWGIAAVVWFKKVYPFLSGLIEKIPVRPGKIITWILTVFMCCNMIVSSAALMRYDQRAQGVEAQNQIEKWVDTHTLRRCQNETDLSKSKVYTLMAFENLIVGCLWCITIIVIPFGKQFFKMARLSFMPFGANVIG